MQSPPDGSEHHLRLHEERLDIATPRESDRLAVVKTDVVTETQTLSIPRVIERIEISTVDFDDSPPRLGSPIVKEFRLVVPLSQERVEVSKRTVVYEEASVGRRRRTETVRVIEPVRREILDVRGPGGETAR